jgi:hypothetical protein
MIKSKPNPLNFYGLRQLEVLPPHFEVVNSAFMYNIQESVVRWIEDNLKGRFYVGKGVDLREDNNLDYCLKIGFEDPKEASYFMLACPHLKYR